MIFGMFVSLRPMSCPCLSLLTRRWELGSGIWTLISFQLHAISHAATMHRLAKEVYVLLRASRNSKTTFCNYPREEHRTDQYIKSIGDFADESSTFLEGSLI